MASSDGELEEQLLQAGNKLVDPPSSVDELLSLLDVKALIFCSNFVTSLGFLFFIFCLFLVFYFVDVIFWSLCWNGFVIWGLWWFLWSVLHALLVFLFFVVFFLVWFILLGLLHVFIVLHTWITHELVGIWNLPMQLNQFLMRNCCVFVWLLRPCSTVHWMRNCI